MRGTRVEKSGSKRAFFGGGLAPEIVMVGVSISILFPFPRDLWSVFRTSLVSSLKVRTVILSADCSCTRVPTVVKTKLSNRELV